eukprot:TRINITY_DN3035_c0_g1_i1.p1 TRINITY_DN3035_c0_g1~~TRINITY_DN3035_c0_g1_i1.p1  ORF type:complete len:1188 (+),score=442.28 TRINITY_DN3035_c0_g1_i1:62-3625(+)
MSSNNENNKDLDNNDKKEKDDSENDSTNKKRKINPEENDNNTNERTMQIDNNNVDNKLNMLEKLITVQNILENIDLTVQNYPMENMLENNKTLGNNEWGILVSQEKDQKIWMMKGSTFTIGRNPKCNLCISDNFIPSSVARITYNYPSDIAFIEQRSRRLSVLINNVPLVVGERKSLQDHDILSIAVGQKKISFKFEKYKSKITNVPTEKNLEQSRELETVPNLETPGSEQRKRKNPYDSLPEKIFMMTQERATNSNNENLQERLQNVFEDISNINIPNQEQFVQFDNSFLFDVLEEDKLDKELNPNDFKEEIKKIIISPSQIDDNLENFPYYIDQNTKHILLYSLYVFLSKPSYVTYTENLTPISRRILLQGLKGTTIYSEKLVRALAKHFNANLIIIDPTKYPDLFQSKKTEKKENEEGTDSQLEELIRESRRSKKSSRKMFEKGDRVRFIGTETQRGPKFRDTGRVIITVDDSKVRNIGVRWDKPLVGGHSLGKYCEKDRGYFVDINDIEKDDLNSSSSSEMALNCLFELLEEKEYQPCIVYIPNCQELMLENKTVYKHFKLLFKKLEEKTKGGSVVISSVENSEGNVESSGKGKFPQGMMISSKANTTLLDFSLFDHLSKIDNDKGSFNKNYKLLKKIMPTMITIKPPTKPQQLNEWRQQIERDVKSIKKQNNISLLTKLMLSNHLCCPFSKISSSYLENYTLTTLDAHKIIGWALSHHIMNEHNHDPSLSNDINEGNKEKTEDLLLTEKANQLKDKEDKDDDMQIESTNNKVGESEFVNPLDPSKIENEIQEKIEIIRKNNPSFVSSNETTSENKEPIKVLEIGSASIIHAISILSRNNQTSSSGKVTKLPEDANEFEKRVMSEVITPDELNVHFDDIGALDNIKESIRELVLLPLKRPELFRKGSLRKPCKGILLFGPPGTGKTMIAKAIATECRANFINVSMSTIGSKWFGEGEKYAKAVFTLAYKIAPSIIFIDEVDSMLGKREKQGEHEAMRKIKNEFMSLWDGLKTQDKERVIVLGATNRPMDLDDAVLRRMPRRLLVDLPDALNREKILKVILKEENIEPNFSFSELAKMTDGFTGSDLRNLCIAAAYIPVKEILSKEKLNNTNVDEDDDMISEEKEERKDVEMRSLTLKDFIEAKKKVSSSISEDSHSITQLRQWNEMYGEGGSKNPFSHSMMYI